MDNIKKTCSVIKTTYSVTLQGGLVLPSFNGWTKAPVGDSKTKGETAQVNAVTSSQDVIKLRGSIVLVTVLDWPYPDMIQYYVLCTDPCWTQKWEWESIPFKWPKNLPALQNANEVDGPCLTVKGMFQSTDINWWLKASNISLAMQYFAHCKTWDP